MLTMNRRELHETNEIYSRIQNRCCQTCCRKSSFRLDLAKGLGIGECVLYNWVRNIMSVED